MANFRRLTDKAKDALDKRGGTEALRADAEELREIAKSRGSLKDKARAAAAAVKNPGQKAAHPTRAPKHENTPEQPGPTRSK